MFGDHGGMADSGEVIVEFYRVGAYVKVSAIDPDTLTEVSIVGAPEAGEEALRRAAIRKLRYVLERRGPRAPASASRRA
ncbi:MAG: hypothetical protein ACE5GS_05260 [Kiloniellaceae bacterium]